MLESREDSLLYSGPLRKKVPVFCAISIGNVRIFINKQISEVTGEQFCLAFGDNLETKLQINVPDHCVQFIG